MFKQLLKILKSGTLLDQAYRQSYEMLDLTFEMFLEAKKSLRETEGIPSEIDISKMDSKVNKFERKVRRKVFQHLTIAGPENLYSGLVLASIIIDIERVGDYTKNIVELASNFPQKLTHSEEEEDLARIEKSIEDIFRRVRRDFEQGDSKDTEDLLRKYIWINPLCDEKVLNYVTGSHPDTTVSTAVAIAMYFRYLKRINSHLQNIATSIVNPFDKIGFLPKDIKKEMKGKEEI